MPVLIESEKSLSESLIWSLQRTFYQNQGVKAWSGRIVPNYVTTNTWIATMYAKVVISYIQDLIFQNMSLHMNETNLKNPLIDFNEPFYLIELGAGMGRFCFYFLNAFLPMLEKLNYMNNLQIRYILTDCAIENLNYCLKHYALKKYIDMGIIDAAIVSSNIRPKDLHLIHSGNIIKSGSLKNPPVVFANYFVCVIEQDGFMVDDQGNLFEALVTIESKLDEEKDLTDPELIGRIRRKFSQKPTNPTQHYKSPKPIDLNQVLQKYVEILTPLNKVSNDVTLNSHDIQGGTSFLIPIGACICLEAIAQLCQGSERLLALCSDKGYNYVEEFACRIGYPMSVEGSFSFMANLHALGCFIESKGGQTFHNSQHAEAQGDICLATSMHILGKGNYAHTSLAFESNIDQFGPVDFMRIINLIQPIDDPTINETIENDISESSNQEEKKEKDTRKTNEENSPENNSSERNENSIKTEDKSNIKAYSTIFTTQDVDFGNPNSYDSINGLKMDHDTNQENPETEEDQEILNSNLTTPKNHPSSDIFHILSVWRLTQWDPSFFWQIKGHLLRTVDSVGCAEKIELEKALRLTFDSYYNIGEEDDIPFELARCAYQLHLPNHQLALELYQESIHHFGDHYITQFNMALCYKESENYEMALIHIKNSLELNDSYDAAIEMRDNLISGDINTED